MRAAHTNITIRVTKDFRDHVAEIARLEDRSITTILKRSFTAYLVANYPNLPGEHTGEKGRVFAATGRLRGAS